MILDSQMVVESLVRSAKIYFRTRDRNYCIEVTYKDESTLDLKCSSETQAKRELNKLDCKINPDPESGFNAAGSAWNRPR